MLETLKQPKPFYLIFFIELWERFGFYGMQALIVLFFVKHLGYSDSKADNLFAAFTALIYIVPVIGGYIGDKLLGTKRTMVLGTLILIVGYTMLAAAKTLNIFIPLAIIAIGLGLFKPNPSSLLSKVYDGETSKLDSGFTLYYMSINIGSLVSMSLTPIIAAAYGWHMAFAVSSVGLITGLIFYYAMQESVAKYGSAPDFKPLCFKTLSGVIGLLVLMCFAAGWVLYHYTIAANLILISICIVLGIYGYLLFTVPSHERNPLFLCLILTIETVIFFVLYYQMPTSLNLFALRNVTPSLWGIHIEPASFQALNPFWILVLGPLLAMLYNWLGARNKDVTMPTKFALGAVITGFAFLVLPFAAKYYAHHGMVSGWWLVLFYFFQAAGELLVSALGFAMVSRYVPKRFMGLCMGIWLYSSAIASIIAGKVASLSSIPQHIKNPIKSLPIYSDLFLDLGLATLAISVVMFAIVPMLNKLSNGKG